MFLNPFSTHDGESPSLEDGVIDISASGLQEIWLTAFDEFQHIFVIADREALPVVDGSVLIEVPVVGLHPVPRSIREVSLIDDEGRWWMNYGGLNAWDAFGSEIEGHFEVHGDTIGIRIYVDDGHSFPITIDPVVGFLPTLNGVSGTGFGRAVLAADWNLDQHQDLLVGEYKYSGAAIQQGRVSVFPRNPAGGYYAPVTVMVGGPAGEGCGAALGTGDVLPVDGLPELLVGCAPVFVGPDPKPDSSFKVLTGLPGGGWWTGYYATLSPISDGVFSQGNRIHVADLEGDSAPEVVALSSQGSHIAVWRVANSVIPQPPTLALDPLIDEVAYGGAVFDYDLDGRDDVVFVYRTASTARIRVYRGQLGNPLLTLGASYTFETVDSSLSHAEIGYADIDWDGRSDIVATTPTGFVAFRNVGTTSMQEFPWSPLELPLFDQNSVNDSSNVIVADLNYDDIVDVSACYRDLSPSGDSIKCYIVPGLPRKLGEIVYITQFATTVDPVYNYSPSITRLDGSGDSALDLVLGNGPFDTVIAHDHRRRMFSPPQVFRQLPGQISQQDVGRVVMLHDLNEDGIDEAIVAGEGFVRVYLGGYEMDSTHDLEVVGPLQTGFGRAIAVGRFRGAGHGASLIIGEPECDTDGLTNNGCVHVYHSPVGSLPDSTRDQLLKGTVDKGRFGASLASASTLLSTDPLHSTLAIGGPGGKLGDGSPGRVTLHAGVAQGIASTPSFTFTGAAANCDESFGDHLAAPGNVDGRHRDDLLIGASFCDAGQSDEGKAFLVISQASGGAILSNWTFESNQTAAEGGVVAAAGDVNGDGRPDFAVGAPLWDLDAIKYNVGRVSIFLGVPTGLPSSTAAFTLNGAAGGVGAQFGRAIVGGKDMNRDGFSDVVVGAPGWATGKGRVIVYSGGTTSPLATLYGRTGASTGDLLGSSVSVGEIDEISTYGDFIVGAPAQSTYGVAAVEATAW